MKISATFTDGTTTDTSESTFVLSEIYPNVRATYINPVKTTIQWDQIENVADYVNVGESEDLEKQISGAQIQHEAMFDPENDDLTISFAGFYQQLITENSPVINRQTDLAKITVPKAPSLLRFEASAKDFQTAEVEFDVVTDTWIDSLTESTLYQDWLQIKLTSILVVIA